MMFYERFDLDDDEHSAEYSSEDLVIKYNMQSLYNEQDFIKAVAHEWLHGLIDWATEGYPKPTDKQEHWILREIGWEYGV